MGDKTGEITGDLTGNKKRDKTGYIIGDKRRDKTGDITGDLTTQVSKSLKMKIWSATSIPVCATSILNMLPL